MDAEVAWYEIRPSRSGRVAAEQVARDLLRVTRSRAARAELHFPERDPSDVPGEVWLAVGRIAGGPRQGRSPRLSSGPRQGGESSDSVWAGTLGRLLGPLRGALARRRGSASRPIVPASSAAWDLVAVCAPWASELEVVGTDGRLLVRMQSGVTSAVAALTVLEHGELTAALGGLATFEQLPPNGAWWRAGQR